MMKRLHKIIGKRKRNAIVPPSPTQDERTIHQLDSLEERLLLSVTVNPEGWTEITPHTTTTMIYVSSSQGSDGNNGLSQGTPVATLSKAMSLVDNDEADWILLKKGDVWYESFGRWQKSGFDADNPMLISSYGDPGATRPLLRTGTEEGIYTLPPDNIHDIAIIGLHFQAHTRDTDSPFFVSTSGKDGIRWLGTGSNLLIEDTRIESYENNIVMQSADGWNGFQLRRSTIIDSYATGQHSQGLFIKNVDGILLEGNVFDHNGWNESLASAEATVFNHNIYIQVDTANVEVRDNIISRASSHGLQARSGGIIEGNLFFENAFGMTFGATRGAAESEVTGTVDGLIFGNVVLNGTDIGDDPRGTGIQVGNAGQVYVYDNIIAHTNTSGANNRGLYIDGDANFGIDNLSIDGNIVHNWGEAVRIIGESDDYNNVDFINNIFSGDYDDDFAITSATPMTNAFYFEGNTYHLPNRDPDKINELQGSSKSISEWAAITGELGASGTDPLFTDPYRSLDSYSSLNTSDYTVVTLEGNTWKALPIDLIITPDTVIEFDFMSDSMGEIHAIRFDTNLTSSPQWRFDLYGSQTGSGISAYDDYAAYATETKHYVIPVGQYFTGAMNYLTFINDHDVPNPDGVSVYRNIRIYTNTEASIDFSSAPSLVSYSTGQDLAGQAVVESNGAALHLTGNTWKALPLNLVVTVQTVLEFDFQSSNMGEIHAIGLDTNLTSSPQWRFDLYGSQTGAGLSDFNNYAANAPLSQHYVIPIGQYFTGEMNYLTFINDHDVANPNGEAVYSNVKIYNNHEFQIDPDSSSVSYGGTGQDLNGTITIEVGGVGEEAEILPELVIQGNAWKKIDLPYLITRDTYITFEFNSTTQGEIHGIGFDDDNSVVSDLRKFQLFGTQYSQTHFHNYDNYSLGDGWKEYTIFVGDVFVGDVNYLTFINDNDNPAIEGVSMFRNIRIGEVGLGTALVDLESANITPYGDQDGDGNAYILSPSSESGFITNIRMNEKSRWNPTFTTAVINSFFQEGFDLVVRPEMELPDPPTVSGYEVTLEGNTWKKIELPYNITRDTYVTFEFRSTTAGEIHGFGFDDDNNVTGETRKYQLYGTQPSVSSILDHYNYDPAEGWKQYTIFVGDDFVGPVQYLVLINDNDAASSNGNSHFRDFAMGEIGTGATLIDFGANPFTSYSNQDGNGTITVVGGITAIRLSGNTWKKLDLGPYNLTANAVVTFEFRSTDESELNGIGFDDDNSALNEDRKFKLFGTQASQVFYTDYENYTIGDGWKQYSIPVGNYFTGTVNYLLLINDSDSPSINGNSEFRNIQISDPTSGNLSINLELIEITSYANQDGNGSITIGIL